MQETRETARRCVTAPYLWPQPTDLVPPAAQLWRFPPSAAAQGAAAAPAALRFRRRAPGARVQLGATARDAVLLTIPARGRGAPAVATAWEGGRATLHKPLSTPPFSRLHCAFCRLPRSQSAAVAAAAAVPSTCRLPSFPRTDSSHGDARRTAGAQHQSAAHHDAAHCACRATLRGAKPGRVCPARGVSHASQLVTLLSPTHSYAVFVLPEPHLPLLAKQTKDMHLAVREHHAAHRGPHHCALCCPPNTPAPRSHPLPPQGFDEYMNLVLDDAEEVLIKKKSRKPLGELSTPKPTQHDNTASSSCACASPCEQGALC